MFVGNPLSPLLAEYFMDEVENRTEYITDTSSFSGEATFLTFDDAAGFAVFGLGAFVFLGDAPWVPTGFLAFDADFVFEAAAGETAAEV